ncbi:hypothetical protein TTHERM_00657520 (macronuclear) [Tetrahymena thermophila SB210]|uniref:Uncharacterized protein n=1 Tax=Tetrahymena thermophila (strain SB210) TaxID=312017 RepID=I7M3N7_TETTS|nr:hypothetical protein TTHERM_00657520 [Tetrahymena thermophila SB210]EAS03807.1 hypothetical protein TTHERM_00657520 [Tetrahymena thermophila SB210]|eukprot:XP_001024052.1 hypothetical protein TTHERM_00657520 [Tetrahymena thermophila SB210]
MDFEEFEDLIQRKEDNVIHLKFIDKDEDKEVKEYEQKKQKVFNFDSSEISIDDEQGKNDILKKVLRGDLFHNQAHEEVENGENLDTTIQDDNKSTNAIKKRPNIEGSQDIFSELNGDNSPLNEMRISRKNIGTFQDEFDKQQIKQIIQEMNNPQERLKMCLIDVKQQTAEELLKEINEAVHQANPHIKKITHHQRRGRMQTVIGIPNQVQMLISQQEQMKLEQNLEKLVQNRSIRQTSNHSTSNNITSQSSMHTLVIPSDKDKLCSGERGANNPQNQNITSQIKVQTQVFNNKAMVSSQDEIDSKGITAAFQQQQQNLNQDLTNSQLLASKLIKSEPLNLHNKAKKSEEFNMFTSIKSEKINDSQVIHSRFQTNLEIAIQNINNEDLSQQKNNQKVSNRLASLLYQRAKDNEEEDVQNSAQFPNIHGQFNRLSNQFYNTPFIGQKNDFNSMTLQNLQIYDEDNIEQKKFLTVQNSENHLLSPVEQQGKRLDILNIMNNLNNNQTKDKKITEKQISNAISSLQDIQSGDLQNDNTQGNKNNHDQTSQIQSVILKNQQNSTNVITQNTEIKDQQQNNNPCEHNSVDQNKDQSIQTSQEQSLKESKQSSVLPESSKNNQNQGTQVQFETSNLNDIDMKMLTTKLRQHRSNTVFYDQEKYLLQMKKIGEMNPNHNHIVTDEKPQEGCVACELHQLMKQHTNNNPKEKPNDQQDVVETKNLFKELPLHVIESRFFLKQISLLKQNTEDGDNTDKPFVMGNRNSPDLKPLRVYFFGREDTYIDCLINYEKTTVLQFVKFALLSYKKKTSLNQSLLKYPYQPSRYKIFPNQGSRPSEVYKPQMESCEQGDNMTMLDATEESQENACCLVEVEDINETENDHDYELKEFQQVYAKAGQLVFKVECKEKEYSTFIRVDKDKNVEDVFEDLIKRKKIDIDRKNYIIQAKIFGVENDVELDLKMPLKIINDTCLKIIRREYEDRQGGSMDDDNKQAINTQNDLVNQYTNNQEDSINLDEDLDDEEDEDDPDLISQSPTKMLAKKQAKQVQLYKDQINQDPIIMTKYEEFEVTKVTYVSNKVSKLSKRIIGIDENFIYNRKVQPKLFSVRGLLCFLFPSSPYDTKCPKKRIDDIKYMFIIEGGNLLIQFTEKDMVKQWLLYNPDLSVSQRMFQKLTYLKKSVEVRVP